MDNGCHLCHLLWESLLTDERIIDSLIPDDREDSHISIQAYNGFAQTMNRIMGEGEKLRVFSGPHRVILDEARGWGSVGLYGQLELTAAQDDPAAACIRRRPDNYDLSSDLTYAKVISWIQECTESHPDCKSPAVRPMPTRVIDVGSCDGSREPFVYESNGESGEYITLSYCWGSSQPTTTTRENVKSHMKRIPLDKLPQTIHDAVLITRKLGKQFLWVDTLCIIQNSVGDTDWQRESSKMNHIYGNAFLTIAACSASDSHDGILARRSEGLLPYRIPYSQLDREECGSVFVSVKEPLKAEDALSLRAWAFQERMLLRRILNYNEEKVSYTCKAGSASGSLGFMLNPSVKNLFLTGRGPKMFSSGEESSAWPMSSESHFNNWYKNIEDYSGRDLKRYTDKLPAISGFAHEMQKLVGGVYLAGIWERDLRLGLLWRSSHGETNAKGSQLRLTATKRAPSWSWAALDGPIHYGATLQEFDHLKDPSSHCAEFLAAEVRPSTFDPLGMVLGGTLEAVGPLKEARWCRRPAGSKTWKPDIFSLGPSIQESPWDILLDVAADGSPLHPSLPAGWEQRHSVEGKANFLDHNTQTTIWVDPRLKEEPVALCTFDIDTDRPPRLWYLPLYRNRGIVLEFLHDRGVYRRVGFFRAKDPGWYLQCPISAITIV
ncbi:hypothetical protein MMC17_009255 [Xylographa soralifera]|nr:hypothetical protein [Xylographa soralifera]